MNPFSLPNLIKAILPAAIDSCLYPAVLLNTSTLGFNDCSHLVNENKASISSVNGNRL
jgi:hypothetical protein